MLFEKRFQFGAIVIANIRDDKIFFYNVVQK